MGRLFGRRSTDHDALELTRHAAARFGRPDHEIPLDVITASAFAGVADLADLHRLSGCVGLGLDGIDGVPDEVRSRLGSAHRLAAVRHLVALRALGPIARRFDDVGIRWLVMKGPVLAAHAYADVGARAYGDLDLLIHPDDLAVAVGVLEDLGYQHVTRNWPLARWYRASEFAMRSGSIELDVHWHVLYAWYDREDVTIDLDAIFERVRRVDVGGLAVPTFDAVDTLVMLALHASKSGTHRLVWLKDIERALAVDRPCLQEVVRRSHEWRVAPRVGVPLARSVSLLDAEVPAEVINALLPRPLRTVDRAVIAMSPPVRAHEVDTLARWWSRSLRGSAPATAWGVVDRTHRAARRLVGRWPGDESADEDEKRRYLDEVATGFDRARIRASGTMRIERLRRSGVGAVATALATDEPRTSVVLCRLRGRWPDRTWVVRDADGSIACVVSLRWLSLDVWTVTVYLADPRAAELAAQLVDRSPARSLTGTAADVDPLLPFLTRARTQMSFPLLVARAPVAGILDDPDGRTRLADRRDLAALVELHRCDEIAPVRTAWQLRCYLWRLLRTTTVVVLVEQGRLLGSAVAQRVAGEFLVIDSVFVHPDARRHGVAWELGKRLLAIATEHQVGAMGALAPTNPMELPRDRVSYSQADDSTHHRLVSLAATRRFRGHGRLRRRYESIQSIASVTADVDLFRDPSDPAASPPGSSRAATQDRSM